MRRAALACALAVVVAVAWRFAAACAPDFYMAVFSYARHPDFPRTEFIDGRLGILQPTFARSYLVIAYRYLSGIGLNPREREQARGYYKDRDTASWDHLGTDWPARWREVRSQIRTPPPPPVSLITNGQLLYDPETHSFALNCAEDAFRVALHTLEDRRARFGVNSRAFRAWLGAQDLVFRNCVEPDEHIPDEPPPGSRPLMRADREYQIAAANFYTGNYQKALDQFRRIGDDPSSPWHEIARYLVVRTLLRLNDDPKSALQAGAELESAAHAILSDPKLASIQGMTLNLVHRAGIRERDHAYFVALARLLSSKGQDDGLREELWDYTGMYDHVIGSSDPNNRDAEHPPPADASPFRDADITDWIFTFQSRDASAFTHALERWRRAPSLPWLLAALSHANAAAASAAGLLDAAVAVPHDSPAFLTARFHLLRLEQEMGRNEAARDGLDALLASAAVVDLPSSVNLLRGLRMLAAPTFADFLQFALRRPVMITLDKNTEEAPSNFPERAVKPGREGQLLDADAARVLNGEVPFSLLKDAALNQPLPPAIQREALMTAFTRGLLLGDDISGIGRRMGEMEPQLTPLVNQYLRETTSTGRRFAAAFLLLHHPEARPYFGHGITRQTPPGKLDLYRDNWWCPIRLSGMLDVTAQDNWDTEADRPLGASASIKPAFLARGAAGARAEIEKLSTLGAATDFLGGIVFSYAKSHRNDARVPEALYWLVRAGHYGCADADTWKTTRAAFRTLHLQYGKTTWAKRTPTWFKN